MKSMLVGLGMVAGAMSLGLVACGDDTPSANSTPVFDIGATSFVTIPPTPVTEAIPTTAPDQPGSILEFESDYTLVEGDLPSTVSAKFKVDFQEFLDLNGFVLEGQFVPLWPPVGSVVKIPAGATVPGEPPVGAATTLAPGTATTLAAEDDEVTEATDPPESETTTTLGGECAPGSYTIVEGDYPGKVAEKFDVSVGALNSANANTKYYSSFAVGVKIVIPAPSDC
jgi:LysM repeat protein